MLILTYTGGNDGFGAQFERILGIYAICLELGINYYHSPLTSIGNQGILALQKRSLTSGFVQECNNKIFLASTVDISTFEELESRDQMCGEYLTYESLQALKDECDKKAFNLLYRIHSPYTFTHINPRIFRHTIGKHLYHVTIPRNKIFTIGIHFRRGDLAFNRLHKHRILPINFYLDVAKKVSLLCQNHDLPFQIELYGESATESFIVSGNIDGVVNLGKRQHKVVPIDEELEMFNVLPNLRKFINESAFETFDRMVNCDILVTSLSSFSTCACYLKTGIAIHYGNYPHVLPRDLVYTDSDFESRLEQFIKTLKS